MKRYGHICIVNEAANPALNEIKEAFAGVKPIVRKYAKTDKAAMQEMLLSLNNMEKDLKVLAKNYKRINEAMETYSYPNEIMYKDAAAKFNGFTASQATDTDADYYEIFIFSNDMALMPSTMSEMYAINSNNILTAINVSDIETTNYDKIYPNENTIYPIVYADENSALSAAKYISKKYKCCVGVCFDEFDGNQLIVSDHDTYFYSGEEFNGRRFPDGKYNDIYAVWFAYDGGEQFNVIMYTNSYQQALTVAKAKARALDRYGADDVSDILMAKFDASQENTIIPLLVKSMDEDKLYKLQAEYDELDKYVEEYCYSRF